MADTDKKETTKAESSSKPTPAKPATGKSGSSSSKPPRLPKVREKPEGGKASARIGVVLSLVALLAVGALAYRMEYQFKPEFQATQEEVKEVSDSISNLSDQDQSLLQKIDQQIARTQQLEQTSATSSAQLREDLEKLIDSVSSIYQTQEVTEEKDLRTLKMRESAELLYFGQQRMQLDVIDSSVLDIWKHALGQLESVDDPRLVLVRRALTEEIEALGQVQVTDLIHTSLRLLELARTADALPLTTDGSIVIEAAAPPEPPESEDGPWWMHLTDELLADLGSLVRVKKVEDDTLPALTEHQKQNVRQHLQMLLLSAHLAIQQRNSQVFQTSIHDANAWLKRHFLTSDERVRAVNEELSALAQVNLEPKPVDLSGSQDLLRKILQVPPGQ